MDPNTHTHTERETREDTHKKTEALIFARGPALLLVTDSLSNRFALSLLLAFSSAVSKMRLEEERGGKRGAQGGESE